MRKNDKILNWNFGPNISSCKSVFYIVKYLSKYLNLKINYLKESSKIFKPETTFLRLSNFKAKRLLKWKPKWSLNKSLDKTYEWNNGVSKKNALKKCYDQIENYFGK